MEDTSGLQFITHRPWANMQKGLKRFLKHRLGRSTNMRVIDENISAYMDFYNNATNVSTTRSVPAERYHGFIDEGWYTRLVKMLKLESVLPIDHVPEGVT
jgi:hypothetical protein